MMSKPTLGSLVRHFLLDYLPQQKGLRLTTIRSYRDTLKLFLLAIATDAKQGVSQLQLEQLTFDRVLEFLRHLECGRHNTVSTRNQRLAALHTFFEFVGRQQIEMLPVSEKVAAIPVKRTPPPETRFLSHDEIQALFDQLPKHGRYAVRDRTLLLFLYNTGARVQEAVDLRVEHVTLEQSPSVRLHGKGGKWRSCPLWGETVRAFRELFKEQEPMIHTHRSSHRLVATR